MVVGWRGWGGGWRGWGEPGAHARAVGRSNSSQRMHVARWVPRVQVVAAASREGGVQAVPALAGGKIPGGAAL